MHSLIFIVCSVAIYGKLDNDIRIAQNLLARALQLKKRAIARWLRFIFTILYYSYTRYIAIMFNTAIDLNFILNC